MKMKYRVYLDTLQNLIGYKPKHADLSEILVAGGLNVSAGALSNRLANDGYISDKEQEVINKSLAVSEDNADIGTIQLDFYDNVAGSCGSGLMVFDESCHKISVPKDVISRYSTTNKYSVILAKGSSMQPEIMDNDKVIIKMWNGEQIIDDRIYLFRYDNEIFLKKLCKNFDQIVVKSNNPEFPHRFIEGDKIKNFNIIGEVVGLLRNF